MVDVEYISVRVYCGGEDNVQGGPFKAAVRALQTQQRSLSLRTPSFIVEYCYIKTIRENNWTIHDLLTWLLDSNIHFILTHVHQGIPYWNCSEVVDALRSYSVNSLRNHVGYPSGNEVDCSIWLQDKRRYIAGW